jgi:hypothetical protein
MHLGTKDTSPTIKNAFWNSDAPPEAMLTATDDDQDEYGLEQRSWRASARSRASATASGGRGPG